MGDRAPPPRRAGRGPKCLPAPARPGRARARRAEPQGRADVHARRAGRRIPGFRPLAARRPRLAPGWRHRARTGRGCRLPRLCAWGRRLLAMRPRPRRDRRRIGTWAVRVVALLVMFAVGVAVGQAMDDASPPAGTNTSIRTLEPATLSAETVTVTVTTAP